MDHMGEHEILNQKYLVNEHECCDDYQWLLLYV